MFSSKDIHLKQIYRMLLTRNLKEKVGPSFKHDNCNPLLKRNMIFCCVKYASSNQYDTTVTLNIYNLHIMIYTYRD